jgi:DNA-binding response OmpR family regulator
MSNPIMPNEAPRKMHILLVDDDEDTHRIFSAYLVEAGFEVLHAADGNEGREMARRFHPDIILTDNRMPMIEGIPMIGMIKREEETKDIPVVLLTNDDLSIEAEKVLRELGADYLHKAYFKRGVWDKIEAGLAKAGKEMPAEAKQFASQMK